MSTSFKVFTEALCCQPPTELCTWCATFGKPPLHVALDLPYVDILDNGDEECPVREGTPVREGSPVRFFMVDSEGPPNCQFRATEVEKFCAGATLELRIGADGQEDAPYVALVDDRSSDGLCSVPRKNPGALTSVGLYNYFTEHPVQPIPRPSALLPYC